MTPDLTADSIAEPIRQPPSTAGMTTKVVKGSLWTLGGQIAPMAFSLLATPFVIRMLGSEAYGVLILVGLIPSYFSFAEFGMSLASTKFGSEAFAEGNPEKEARVIRTAAFIALIASAPIAISVFALSPHILALFNVPAAFLPEATLALRLAAVSFVINFLNGIFNTPQLARLRMDLNTFVTSGFKILGLIATPFVIYLGYGIVGATFVLMLGSIFTLVGHIYVSQSLLPDLKGLAIDRDLLKPLGKFGSSLVFSGIAAVLLANLEKLVLVRTTSVEILAYYSVAYTLAMMAAMFSQSMTQSLIPAFSQLITPDKKKELYGLFSRSVRFVIIVLLPTLASLFIVAKPIFVYLGGEDFGRESTGPFRILLFGLLFNILAYTPYSLLMASGRSDIFAKLYWAELLPYVFLIAVLALRFGAVGVAAAWSIRVIVDALIIGWLAVRVSGVSFDVFKGTQRTFVISIMVLVPPVLMSAFFSEHFLWLGLLSACSLLIYVITIWRNQIEVVERDWIIGRFRALIRR